jgi:major membrane immunogen (membrane-anchored lipoprotein)
MKNLLPVALVSALVLASCGNTESTTESMTDTTAVIQASAHHSISLADVSPSPDFPGASLTIGNVTAAAQGDSVKLTFNFNVKNYELKAQTADAGGKLCNNSDKGQHIHFIIDNKPYVALYEPKYETVVAKNTEHNVLVFLSRSYHESLKSKGASALYHFKIDANGKLQKMDAPKTPMVFYSRPKGDYLGKDVENVLFDFYVMNTTLGQGGNQVKAHVTGNGVDTSFMVTEWKSQFLKNLPMGKNSITLTLVDQNSNRVEGPETEVTREFNLSQDEPMTK